MTSKQIYDSFKIHFEKINGKPFAEIEGVTLENLKPIFHYFATDNRFFERKNLSKLSEPSFENRLLILGTFGNGKTSTMNTLESMF